MRVQALAREEVASAAGVMGRALPLDVGVEAVAEEKLFGGDPVATRQFDDLDHAAHPVLSLCPLVAQDL